MTAASPSSQGFTLLEVAIAFIIAALALAALTRGAAVGLQSSQAAAHYQEAISRARSHLATIGLDLQPGEQTGDDGGGYTWRLRIEPTATTPPPPRLENTRPEGPARAKRATLYTVAVTISWRLDGGVREVDLTTQRLGEAPAAPP